MADATAPSSTAPAVANGTFPENDAAGQTVAAIAEADKISAGRNDR
jgi:ubiquitin-like 1-activating enzyme E1 A